MIDQKNVVAINYVNNIHAGLCDKIVIPSNNVNNNNEMPSNNTTEVISNNFIISIKKSHSLSSLKKISKNKSQSECEDNKLLENVNKNYSQYPGEYILPYRNNSKKSKYIELPDKYNNQTKGEYIFPYNSSKKSKYLDLPECADDEEESITDTIFKFKFPADISYPSLSEYSSVECYNKLSNNDNQEL